MRIHLIASLAAGLLSAAAAPAAVAQTAPDATILAASTKTPEAFVQALLKSYADGDTPRDQLPDNQRFFSAATTALIAKVNAKEEGGAFNVDPFCDCQDWNKLTVQSVTAKLADASHGFVIVSLEGDAKLTQAYALVREAGGWRIDDIVHPSNGSMVARLNTQ